MLQIAFLLKNFNLSKMPYNQATIHRIDIIGGNFSVSSVLCKTSWHPLATSLILRSSLSHSSNEMSSEFRMEVLSALPSPLGPRIAAFFQAVVSVPSCLETLLGGPLDGGPLCVAQITLFHAALSQEADC